MGRRDRGRPALRQLLREGAQNGHHALVSGMGQSPRRAQLDVEYRERYDGTWLSSAILLIDGDDLFATVGPGGHIGLPPADLTYQESLVEPGEKPERVVLYRCTCGEAGCSAVTARCYRMQDDVVWDLFDPGNPPPLDLATHRPAADALVFAAETYDVFVSRVRELAARHPDAR